MDVVFDARDVQRVFKALPAASTRKLGSLIEGGAIDVQRDMRKRAPVHDGEYRRSIAYKMGARRLSATIGPSARHAEWVEEGTRPHWTSVKKGTPLRKWADDKGINPFAVQWSIARKGTKGQWVVEKSYNFTHRRVERDITTGMARFIKEVDNGRI
jgi:hypothetical protein